MSIVREYEILLMNDKLNNLKEDKLLDNLIKRLIERVSKEILVFNDKDFAYCVKGLIDRGLTFVKVEKNEEGFRLYVENTNDDIEVEGEFIIG